MKKSSMKIGVILLLVAVLVSATVFPLTTSQAATKKTTYNVVIQDGSMQVSLASINDGAASPQLGKLSGTTFQIVVEEKAKTEKVKSTGGKATYYKVVIPKKSFKIPATSYPMPGGGTTVATTTAAKDGKGKLYLNGGDVDVSAVQGEKKLVVKIGDGKEDAAYSLLVPITLQSTMVQDGKKYMSMKLLTYLTTGTVTIAANKVKGGLNGKSLPENDTSKSLPKPLVGEPLDLEAGTGTLVSCSGIMNVKNKVVGKIDQISANLWNMKIAPR